ncbi:MAG: acetate--CoA ligase [Acidimicrobiales bacterium]|nr:acetate--CoA ligase [Acidimicrobiales bacterium]
MTDSGSSDAIEQLMEELRTFEASEKFKAEALVRDRSMYEAAAADRLAFWAEQASGLDWVEPWSEVLDWSDAPFARWFVDGKLNVSANCLDRHVANGLGDRVAYYFEGEPGDKRTITYAELFAEVQQAANALKDLGVKKGDRIAIYMPMIPELPVAMLACARIGAAHSVVFGGFSAASLSDRIIDAEAQVLITADGGYRRGAPSMLKGIVDDALQSTPTITDVLVVQRIGDAAEPVNMQEGRDHWWHDVVPGFSASCPPEVMDAEDLLYLLYTSGTTGKPKGIMHTTGGYLTQAAFTHKYVFDLHPETDIYWCAADIGWVTGHSYIVYGPLANGCTSLIYEGTPDTPTEERRTGDRAAWAKDRFWEIIANYGVTKLYTAPTAIRTFMKWGTQWPQGQDLSSLKVLGSVGEPINPEAWVWYHTYIGGGRCPIVDTWWQTETGAMMIAPLPAVTTLKPGSASGTLPGISAELVDDAGQPVGVPGGGYLTITEPWPSMLRGIWGDPQRYKDTYWSRFPGRYFAGDGAKFDADGDIWLLGRVDDVMNISGHRLSTTEIESALVDHPAVAEAAVVGRDDATTGQAISAFVILRGGVTASPELQAELRNHVATLISPIAKPADLAMVPELPKTRSGKIMRRLLRDMAEGRSIGDTTTLADPSIVPIIEEALNG